MFPPGAERHYSSPPSGVKVKSAGGTRFPRSGVISWGGSRDRYGAIVRHVAAIMIARIAFSLVLTAALAAPVAAAQQDGVAATKLVRVNEHVITLDELNAFLNLAYMDEKTRAVLSDLAPLHRDQLLAEGRKRALEDLIERNLILTEARKVVGDNPRIQEVVDLLVEKHLRQIHQRTGSQISMHNWLREQGLTLQEWKSLIADSIVLQNYLRENLRARIQVTPAEMRRYYERNRESFRTPKRIMYRLILVDPAGCETPDEERAKAEMILNRLKEGEDFGKLADAFSLERDKFAGGLRTVEAPATPPDWLPPLCAGLRPGECSGILETEAGFCIARLENVIESRTRSFDETQDGIQETLHNEHMAAAQKQLIQDLRRKSRIEIYPEGQQILNQ